MGEEAYYIDLIMNNIEKYVISEDDKDFNYNVFYGNEADLDCVVATAQQFPVMADKKLVVLKEAQSMHQAKTQLEKLAPYLASPNKSTVFVLTYKGESLNATSKLIKAAKQSKSIIFNSEKIPDYKFTEHVRDYCSSNKVLIEPEAVGLLCEYIGPPLSKLVGEINKLVNIIGDKSKKITCEDIEKHIGVSKDYNNFELMNALGEKDYPKAIKIVKYFENSPKLHPTPVSTGLMVNLYSNLVIAHYLPDKSDNGIMEAFGFKARIQLTNLKTAMRNYTPMQAVNAIHHLREFDAKSKGIGSVQNEYSLMKELIFKLFT